MTDKLREAALWKLLTEAREALWQPANPDLCGRIDEALAQQDAQAAPQEYSGVRCMCVLTGCRAGPGCPRYNSHCRAHINHVNAAPTPPAQEKQS